MHGNNPTQDSIERALAFAVTEGLIRSWRQVPFHGGARHAKWEVEVNASVHSADGLGTYVIRTYHEGQLFCAALASARSGLLRKSDAWATLVGEYRAALDTAPGAGPTEADADSTRGKTTVDVSDVDGVLAGFETRHDDDGETQLICTTCGRRVCYVDNDPMDTLVRLCLDHEHEEKP